VVLDAGNGCAWELAPKLFRRLGCRVETLFCEPDGTFPNHIPDPTLPETLETLRARVLETGADLGLAYDGDADRLGALDEQGTVVWGDQLLALFARQVLERSPGAPILFEVKCSRALVEDIEAHGGKPVMTRTGHSIIKTAMKKSGSPLAGEMSGHMFFADDWYGFDDALYASGRLVQLVAGADRPLSELVADLPRYYATPEIRVTCADERKFDVVEAVRARYRRTHPVVEVDGARVEFPDGCGMGSASSAWRRRARSGRGGNRGP
jgi:phosphomannomutase/phosphoglucomutase